MNSIRVIRKNSNSRAFEAFVTLVAFALLITPAYAQPPCTLCRGGEQIPWPEKDIKIEGIPIDNCGVLDMAAGAAKEGELLCDTMQDVGTLCGCPIPEGSCTLCQDGSRVTNLDVQLDDFFAADYLPGAPEGIMLTCEVLEALLHSSDDSSAFCANSQIQVYERCGCPEPVIIDDNIFNRTDVPEETEPPKDICTVCVDGEPMGLPDKPIDLSEWYINKCSDINAFAAFYLSDSPECAGIQALGAMCGCSFKRNECTLCANGEPPPLANKPLPWLRDVIKVVPEQFRLVQNYLTCEMYDALLSNIEDNTLSLDADLLCLGGQFKSGFCGCSYDWKPVLLVWSARVSGILSLLGSTYIIFDILKSRRKRKTTYHQLVLGISGYDCVSSLAYALSTVMTPEDTGLYGAVGTETTCQIQGTMIQLGLTSVYYNALLSIYFLLMVNFNWREERFQQRKLLVHVPVNVIGLGMAFAAIPFYFPQFAVCYIVQPPVAANWIPLSVFYTVPVILALVILVVSTIAICVKVFNQEAAVARYTVRRNRNLSRKVFWQSFWYVMSFMITFPLLIVSYFLDFRSYYESYTLFVIAGLLAPLQGTLNAFVYFNRSSKLSCLSCCSCRCCQGYKDGDKNSSSGSNQPVEHMAGGTTSAIELYSRASRINALPSRMSEQDKYCLSSRKEASRISEASMTWDEAIGTSGEGESVSEEEHFAGVREFWEIVVECETEDEVGETDLKDQNIHGERVDHRGHNRCVSKEGKLFEFLHKELSVIDDEQSEPSRNQGENWEDDRLKS